MSYEAGTAFLQVVPSFAGVVDSIAAEATKWGQVAGKAFASVFNKAVEEGTDGAHLGPSSEKSTRQGSDSGGAFAAGFRARIDAALRALPEVDINADSSEADRKIAEIRTRLETLRDIDIGVDLSDAQAIAAVEVLKLELDQLGAKSPSIRVRVDAGKAVAELGAVTLAADGASGSSGGGGLLGLGSAASAAAPEISAMAAGIGALVLAAAPLGALALGGLSTLPAILAGAATGIGVLALGFSGIGGAISAYTKQQNAATAATGQSTTTAITNAATIRNAATAVETATEGVANARTAAASQLTTAENQVTAAAGRYVESVYTETEAQKALLAARQAAADQLTNYADQLADGALQAKQLAFNVQDAQSNLDSVKANPASTPEQIEKAQLALDQAKQAVKDQADQYAQLQQAATAAQQAGVDGADSVIQAQHQLQGAQTATSQSLRGIGAASANVTTVRMKGAQQVADAERTLKTALDNQTDALKKIALSSKGAGTATKSFATAMAGLSPAGQAFVTFVTQNLLPAFDRLKARVQAGLLPGVAAALTDLLPAIGPLSDLLSGSAVAMGQFAQQVATFLGSKQGMSDMGQIFGAGAGFMRQMGDAALILLRAFGAIGSQATPIVQALRKGILDLVGAFGKWVSNGGFETFVHWLAVNGPSIVSDISSIAKLFGTLLVALAPTGTILLGAVGAVAKLVSGFFGLSPLLAPIAVGIAAIAAAVLLVDAALDANPVVLLITAIVVGISALVAGIIELVKHWSEVMGALSGAATWVYDNVIQPVFGFFKNLPDRIVRTLEGITGKIWSGLKGAAKWVDDNVLSPVVTFFTGLPGRIVSALAGTGTFLGQIFGDAIAALGKGGTWLATNIGDPILGFFSGLPDKIAKVAKGMWNGVADAFVEALNAVIKVWNNFHIPAVKVLGIQITPEIDFPNIPTIKKLANGTGMGTASGMMLVGERGPELMNLGRPVQVIPNHALRGALSGGSSAPIIGNVYVQDPTDVGAVLTQATFLQKARRI